ncbi:MAG TPA: hypothetical protein VMV40_03325 [Acidiferrobacter sp.]|nr:hypothetical protein [Acidiferrobacter sp.]
MTKALAQVGPDPELMAQLRKRWLVLIEIAVWGDIRSDKLGLLGKLRKRFLDLGERLKSLEADRTWIPRQRERLKNLLGSCLSLRDALLLAERTAQDLTGGTDLETLGQNLIILHTLVVTDLQKQENTWAQALAAINKSGLSEDDEE